MNAKKKLPAILDVYYDENGVKVTVYEMPQPKSRTWDSKGVVFNRGNQGCKFGSSGINASVVGHKQLKGQD